jgi:DNA-directed RNA polymerase subunit M/transcription elongation factor TFIIS
MIRRLQPGYKPVGALHSHSDDKPKVRYCQRCLDLFQVSARLGPRIMPLDVASGKPILKPHDYDLWLECRNCGTLYPKHETKVEAELEAIKEPSDGKQPKSQVIETKKKKGRGSNSRLKGNKWEIKDEELKAELRDGVVLMAYSSTDPSEPTI